MKPLKGTSKKLPNFHHPHDNNGAAIRDNSDKPTHKEADDALGRFHAGGAGAYRDEAKAIEDYRRAAERGHTEAQYALGAMYADGRGVEKNLATAAERYEKAATRGLPEAANSLGRLYKNGIGVSADREKAIEWYYRAAVAFKKAGRREDAEAIIHHLDSLARQYPAVLGLVTRLRQMLALAKE
jgi:TPR repeat protein